jgi:putative DNA primase/helicase
MRFFPENIPEEIKESKQWVLWKKEPKSDGKIGKVPYQPNGKRARSNDPTTWYKLNTAITVYQDVGGFDGVCWMMPVEPGNIVFIDIDNCIKNGIIESRADEIIKKFNSYTEKSQSGNGVHILIKGKKPIRRCRKCGSPFEIYDCLRPCYLTGDII